MTVLLDILASLSIGVLAGLGVGSGGLMTVYLSLVRGVAQLDAQGINLLFFTFALAAAAVVHLKKRKIEIPLLLICTSFATVGAIIGSLMSLGIDPHYLRQGFGLFLIVAGIITFIPKKHRES